MRKYLAVVGLFSTLTISGVMTLTLTSNDTTPVRGKGLQLSCLTSGESLSSTLIWLNPQNVKLSTCYITQNVCSGNTSSYSFTLDNSGGYAYINSLSRENDTGTWKCVYVVVTATIEIKVYIQVEGVSLCNGSSAVSSILPVVDGVSISVYCQTTLSLPASIIIWYKGDNVVRDGVTTTNLTSNGLDFVRSSLTLTPTNIDDGRKIYCQAYNLDPLVYVTSIRATVQVTVYIKSVTMSPSGSPLIFLEGQEKSVQCVTSPSRPRPQVRWWLGTEQVLGKITESESSSDNLIVTTSVISLTLNRSHTRKPLYCDATVTGQNPWISSTKSDVTVQYAPDVSVNLTGSTVVGSTAVLMCTVQGDPPQYTFHPWIHRVGQTEIRRLNGVNTDNISILTLSNISIQDMGSYICTVDNSITGLDGQLNQTGDTSLYVQGRPFIDKIQTPFTGELFKPIIIQIPFYSHTSIQKPTLIKQIASYEIRNISDISSYILPSNITMMFYNKKVMIPGYVAVLQFRNLTETDFGKYTLKLTLTNDKGSETMQFEFIASGPPSTPKQFFFININDGFLVFGLEKGFNGGHEQTFVVEYHPSGNLESSWSTVLKINETNLEQSSTDGVYYIKIPKVQDGMYTFRVYAENVKGTSSAFENVYADIKSEQPPGSPGFQVGAVVGGVVGGILLVVVIVVVIVVMRRCKLNPKMKEYEREEESTDQSSQLGPLYANTSYDGDVSATAYESLQAKSTTESPYQTFDKDPNNGGSEPLAIRSQGSEKIYINTAIDSAFRDKEYEGLQLTQIDSHPYSQLSGKNKSTEM